MQKVAAYILERTEGLHWPDARKGEGERLRVILETWLKGKGGTASAEGSGTYEADDGSDASYREVNVVDGDRSWRMFELSEVTKEGRKFVTSVSVTVGHKNVVVFVTMEVGSVASSISRVEVDPKCPKVVRDLLAQGGPWSHGASRLQTLSKIDGFDAGESLALEIQNRERTIPFVVVSSFEGQPALPRLDEWLANDLAGIANVYSLDEQASWALTDVLRKPLSTYGGAIRIYWPRISETDAPFRHQLWTASRLQGLEVDLKLALARIRRQVRTIIMRASAATVVRPREIDDIRGAHARSEQAALQAKASELDELKAKAKSLEEFQVLAYSYAAENDGLRQRLAERDVDVMRLEADKEALLFQFEQVRDLGNYPAEVEPDSPAQDESDQQPIPGEVRFYKKTHSKSAYDILVRRGDCGHKSWQASNKADKAKKGLARLLGKYSEWKKLEHCGSCEGGGVWRVEW